MSQKLRRSCTARGVQHSAKSCSLKAPPPTQADLMGTTTGPSPSHDAGDPGDPGSPSTQAATGSAARSAAYATTSNVQPAAQMRGGQARPDLSLNLQSTSFSSVRRAIIRKKRQMYLLQLSFSIVHSNSTAALLWLDAAGTQRLTCADNES